MPRRFPPILLQLFNPLSSVPMHEWLQTEGTGSGSHLSLPKVKRCNGNCGSHTGQPVPCRRMLSQTDDDVRGDRQSVIHVRMHVLLIHFGGEFASQCSVTISSTWRASSSHRSVSRQPDGPDTIPIHPLSLSRSRQALLLLVDWATRGDDQWAHSNTHSHKSACQMRVTCTSGLGAVSLVKYLKGKTNGSKTFPQLCIILSPSG